MVKRRFVSKNGLFMSCKRSNVGLSHWKSCFPQLLTHGVDSSVHFHLWTSHFKFDWLFRALTTFGQSNPTNRVFYWPSPFFAALETALGQDFLIFDSGQPTVLVVGSFWDKISEIVPNCARRIVSDPGARRIFLLIESDRFEASFWWQFW